MAIRFKLCTYIVLLLILVCNDTVFAVDEQNPPDKNDGTVDKNDDPDTDKEKEKEKKKSAADRYYEKIKKE